MVLPALLLAGCAQLPPSPQDMQAKKFESMPDKSVIYVVRMPMDSNEGRSLMLNDGSLITTYRGTYYRWEVAPGTHRVAGFPGGSESVTLTTTPGSIYFLEHTVVGDPDDGGVQATHLRQIGEPAGRNLVLRSELLK
jgi:hypothetical protein